MTVPSLGIVEGYFGRAWTWAERHHVMRFAAGQGYSFFLYAPKENARLRRQWRDPFDEEELRALADFAAACRSAGVAFGVGLSPFEVYADFNASEQAALAAKLEMLDAVGLDALAILFDDMSGAVDRLAERQVEVAHFAAARTAAHRLIVCPTYYSDDPVLDRVFGARPPDYLSTLGARLDPRFEIFWTGEEVCSLEYSPGHLRRVADRIGRKPLLWDNYPVNDGPRMSRHLHLRAFTGRPASIGAEISGHAVNPALQPVLSCIPMLSLRLSYQRGAEYRYGAALAEAAEAVAGPELAAMLIRDLLTFQDGGLDRIGDRRAAIRARYEAFDHPAAREVIDWLDEQYAIAAEVVQTQ